VVVGEPLGILDRRLLACIQRGVSTQLGQDVGIEPIRPLRGLASQLSAMAGVPLRDSEPEQLLERERQAPAVLDVAEELEKGLEDLGAVTVDAEDVVAAGLNHPGPELGIVDLVG
jgi:hypothetical protein